MTFFDDQTVTCPNSILNITSRYLTLLFDTKMTNGPFKGLYTTNSKAGYLYTLQDDISNIAKTFPVHNIMVYPANPGIYLFSKLKPHTNALWLIPDIENTSTLKMIKEKGQPDVTIIFNELVTHKESSLLKAISSDGYLKYFNHQNYSVYLLKNKKVISNTLRY